MFSAILRKREQSSFSADIANNGLLTEKSVDDILLRELNKSLF